MTEIEKAVEEIGKTLPPTSQKAYEAGQPNAVWGLTDGEFEKVSEVTKSLPLRVVRLDSQNGSCPAQWHGTTESGLHLYGRYRHSCLSVCAGTTEGSAVLGVELFYRETDGNSGFMDTPEFIKILTDAGVLDFSTAEISFAEGY